MILQLALSRRITTSRAFWNLRAEQVMDRVFDLQEPPKKAAQIKAAEIKIETPSNHCKRPNWRIIGLTALAASSLISSLWLARSWQFSNTQLSRERNLLLLERIRQLPATADTSNADTANADTANARPTSDSAPESLLANGDTGTDAIGNQADQKPQTEATIELTELPQQNPTLIETLEPVTVPFPHSSPQEPTIANVAAVEALPILVGVVHAPGGDSSAIFQLENSSTSATPGDSIGSSGWRLTSVTTDGAVIERQGDQRRLSVGGAF